MTGLKGALLTLGLALLAVILWRAGPGAVLEALRPVGWGSSS